MGLKQKTTAFWKENLESLAHLLFPNMCLLCTTELSKREHKICHNCLIDLPKTKLTADDFESSIHQLFWGRVQIENSFAWLIFSKSSTTQTLLHHIKYKDNPQLAQTMGALMATEMEAFSWLSTVDALIPVPIHPKKKFIRGYNQSEEIAKGIQSVVNLPIDNHFLKRALHTESQTRKGRFGRWDNIEDAFRSRKQTGKYHHVAIVDDVITTGATMERIILQIHEKNPDLRVSVISLALAQ